MAGAYGGARLGILLPGAVQLLVLAAVMLAAAGLMLRRQPPEAGPQKRLQQAFGVLLVLVAGMMLVENLTAVRAPHPAAAAVVESQHR